MGRAAFPIYLGSGAAFSLLFVWWCFLLPRPFRVVLLGLLLLLVVLASFLSFGWCFFPVKQQHRPKGERAKSTTTQKEEGEKQHHSEGGWQHHEEGEENGSTSQKKMGTFSLPFFGWRCIRPPSHPFGWRCVAFSSFWSCCLLLPSFGWCCLLLVLLVCRGGSTTHRRGWMAGGGRKAKSVPDHDVISRKKWQNQ